MPNPSIKVTRLDIPGLLLVEPLVHGDARGFFVELFRENDYAAAGVPAPPDSFVQDNLSRSAEGVLRGLHFQRKRPQGKLVTCLSGEIFDVAVDLRTGSPAFGKWHGEVLSSENHRQLYVPAGFAHGFSVLRGPALIFYKCTAYYDPSDETGVRFGDPRLAVHWRVQNPLVSGRDRKLPFLKDIPPGDLPNFAP